MSEWTEKDRAEMVAMFESLNLSQTERGMFDAKVLRGDRPLELRDKWAIDSILEDRAYEK